MKGPLLATRVENGLVPAAARFQFHSAPTELKACLSLEILDSLKQYHTELLEEFARTNRNEFRVEIQLFRSLLKNLISWSEGVEEFIDLFDRSHWWEWYWYEREYDDSQFCEISAKEQKRLLREKAQFNRRRSGLIFPTLNFNYFAEELQDAVAAANDPIITTLCSLFPRPNLRHFHYLFSNASPAARTIVSRFLSDKLAPLADSKFNPKLLNFIDLLSPAVQISWHSDWLTLFIRFDGLNGVAEREIKIGIRSPEWMWIKEHSGIRQYVLGVSQEAHSDFGQLIADVKRRAVV